MAAADIIDIDRYKLDTEIVEGGPILHQPNLHLGKETIEAWGVEKLIGEGGFGSVWLQKETSTGKLRAVKRIFVERSRNFPHSRELRALVKVREYRRLFVEFIGWYESADFVYVAMEYLRCGDLEKYLKEFRSKARTEVKEITTQLLEGLVVLHGNNICHRDLKTNNILIARRFPIWVKLADFGTSKSTINTSLRTKCGTSGYMAPEVLGAVASRGRYTSALDIWSLGCVIYEILTSELPFTRKTEGQDSSPSSTESVIVSNGTPDIDILTLVEYCNGRIGLPVDALSKSGVNENTIKFLKVLLAAQPAWRTSASAALRSASGWAFEMPEEFYHEDGPDFLKKQLHSLGLELSFEAVEHLIMQCKACTDVDITKLGIRHVSDELIIGAIRRGYNLIFDLLLPSSVGDKIVYLTEAVLCRNTKVVAALVRGLDINAMGPDGLLLPLGVRFGDLEIVELLLGWGANVNAILPDSRTALSYAVELGFLKKAKLLLDWGAGIDFATLALAIRLGNLDMVTLLLSQEANISSSETFNKPPLESLDIVGLLLEWGADVNNASHHPGTALNLAVKSRNRDMVTLLLDRGADVSNESNHPGAALNLAVKLRDRDMVTLLLDRGADINIISFSSGNFESALILAMRSEDSDVVTLLLDRGADVNGTSRYAGTALNFAVNSRNCSLVTQLLDQGTDVNALSRYFGITSLGLAIRLGYPDMVTLLLDRGADVNAASRYPGTALNFAVNSGNCKMVRLLLDRGAGVDATPRYSGTTALGLAVNLGNHDMLTLLLDRGEDVNAISHYSGTTALGLAVNSGNCEMVTLFLDRGMGVDSISRCSGTTALGLAIHSRNRDIVTLLLDRGADVNAISHYSGTTALGIALNLGNHDMVTLLRDRGAGINSVPSRDSESALVLAMRLKDFDMVTLLLDRGADVNLMPRDPELAMNPVISSAWLYNEKRMSILYHYPSKYM